MAKKRKISWLTVSFVFLSALLGVSLALILNNWQQKLDDRKQEQAFLNIILNNIGSDIAMFDSVISADSNKLNYFENNKLKIKLKKLTKSEAFNLINNMMNINNTNLTQTGYYNLTQSGKLNLIESIWLRNEIIKYYNQTDKIKYLEKLNNDFLNQFLIPLTINHFDYIKQDFTNAGLIKSQQFINICISYHTILNQHYQLNINLKHEAQNLRKEIANYLKIDL